MSSDHVQSAERSATATGAAARPSSAEAPFLELLARGASADAYEQPVLLARAEGRAAGLIAGLEYAKTLALRVRSELEGRRRREAELSALFETAHDLAGLRDLDAVLQAIVQRARSLLGTDVAYLSLNDPARGDTYMRVTEGSVAARFQQLRLGMGEGLGGLVAQTARPYVTDDYFRDERFEHTDTIDSGVRDEGLVAILGVPLMLGHRVIGVLFAADRRARVFEREQIALLGSFAALAAAAMDTANLRLLGRTGDGAAAEDFGFLGLLLAGDRDIGGFVERTIGEVVRYDERRGTDLLRTLDAYFACGMSPARTKDDLHVHVNTVAQRLERVGQLLGEDWQEPARVLEVQLALRLRRLAAPVRR
ncbi:MULTISPECIES: GAF domain-containing protein [unclassified Streptomyces]|uniref:helix-turn-helix domain-containing protein n=1 Tax=unclassified Streptomyces TaxID=2593676 RepID=UPI002E2B5900|nr:GAF domain-containing protein [Streptomyces sp. NBC_00228]